MTRSVAVAVGCECCARSLSRGVGQVNVPAVHKRTSERRSLALCTYCAVKAGATWRLSWRPVGEPERIEGLR
jgi:hypothetical protein